jgi:hypothetical protein
VARIDPELELYRGLIDYPDKFEEGFDIKAIIGALFVGFVMMPGAIYLGLLAGASLGPAATWTTVILFTEVARRSFVTLKKQEIYILVYIAGAVGGNGGAFAPMIWNQYFVRSPAARGMGIASQIPYWVVPPPNSEALLKRTFFHPDWVWPIILMLIGSIIGRMNWFGLGYFLFRVTSDFEKLPFPFAAVSAQGSLALAEASSKAETWRWRTFSIGAMVGLVFGAFYVGIPTITGTMMSKPLMLLPIPWVDLTTHTENILPAVPTGFYTELGNIGAGFVAPFWAVMGSVASAVITMFLNPALYRAGVLTTWKPGMDTIATSFANTIDFYFSVTIGVAVAVAVIGFYTVFTSLRQASRERAAGATVVRTWAVPEGRGDVPIWLALGLWVVSTLAFVILCRVFVKDFPWPIVVFFGFILTPINSYIDARMLGLTGQWVSIPMVKQAAIIFSHYKGIDIWFAPIPDFQHGPQAQAFRIVELTGTKITSTIKAELLILPITIVCSLIFWQFIWHLAPIPSVVYPWAQKMWHLQALQQGLWLTATMNPARSLFYQAWNPSRAIGGLAFGLGAYVTLSWLRLPIMLVYGVVQGLGTTIHGVIPTLIGALLSQYYFGPKFGMRRWKQYATVLMAGYACGMGLVGMGTVAIAMIAKSVSQAPF